MYKQRRKKTEGLLTIPEEEALSKLGFRWQLDVDDLDMEEMLQRLEGYRATHGDTLVPKKYERDPLLGAWVCACRRKADPLLNGGRSMLTLAQTDVLNNAGFSWEPERRCGSSFMKGLRAYGEAVASGHALPESWCEAQRKARREGKLSEQRVSYLDKFGFDWD